jgi:short-subunit dehydrogenase
MSWTERFGGAALVTGASSGIGRAFCLALARQGMDIVLVARRRDRLDALARTLEGEFKVRAHALAIDLGANSAATSLARSISERHLDIGLLIQAAGFGQFGHFAEQHSPRALEMVDLNCRAVVELAYAFLPPMLERRRGGLIFLASTAAFQPVPLFATYAATKAFNLSFGEALWAELSPRGLEVLTVCPGYTPTEFQDVARSHRPMPAAATTTAEQVVDAALAALGRRAIVVPGILYRLLAVFSQVLPRSFVLKMGQKFLSAGGASHGPRQ